MVNTDVVNWESDELKRWLDSITRKGTRANYRSAFRRYTLFVGKTPSALIDEALEDAKKDTRYKQDIVLKRLVNFYNYLKTEYPMKSRGRGPHKILGKGVSDKLASMYVNSIRSFYATFGVTVRMKGRHKLPKPRVKNKRMIVAADQVKTLVQNTRNLRDRAMILTLFQSGMDVSTLCNLTFGDVAEGLTKEENPLKLELYRPKTGTEYYSFLGKDAVESLKNYIADMKARGVTFHNGTSLFLKERGKEQLTTNLVQNMMRDVSVRAGFVNKQNNGNSFNPLGPHSLRESFGSIMLNSGVPDTVVDFWLGHEIGEMAEAYKTMQFESVKRMYAEREKLLSISAPKIDVEELKEKLKGEIEQQNRQLQTLVNSLLTENMDLKNRMGMAERKLEGIAKMLRELRSET